MNFLSPSEVVEKPCKDIIAYPVQCFQEMFLATPAVVGTFFVGIGGFAIAVIIWGAIFALALFSIFFVLKHLYRVARHFFTKTRLGQKIATIVPVGRYMQRFCSKAQEVQPKKLINTQAIGDYSANIVSKVHVDSKWFKSALKHVPFGKPNESDNSNMRSPSKTPQRSTSRISALTPKILSPKSHKQ